jgi:hypothetical protein
LNWKRSITTGLGRFALSGAGAGGGSFTTSASRRLSGAQS